MDWFNLALETDLWRTILNTVMKFLIPLNAVNFWLRGRMRASKDELCFMEVISYRLYRDVNTKVQ
jgi:hypothetical protein